MKKSVTSELLQSACDKATRRMEDLGVPSAGFRVQDCPRSNGLHIEILRHGVPIDSLHVWDPGDGEITEAQIDAFLRDLCSGIREAEKFWKGFKEYVNMLRETYERANSYGIPTRKEWVN